MSVDPAIKRLARICAGSALNTPVKVTATSDAPEIKGERWHLRDGVRVPDTRRVEVGLQWVANNLRALALCRGPVNSIEAVRIKKLTGTFLNTSGESK